MTLLVRPKTEVLVAGAGPAGIVAAIAAARTGARPLLVERYGFVGGEAVTGLTLHGWHNNREEQIVWGIPWEMVERLKAMGAAAEMRFTDGLNVAVPPHFVRDLAIDREAFQQVALEMLEEAEVQTLLHSYVSDVMMEGEVVRGLVVENKSGRMLLPAERVVDCTGDGDVAARGGAPFEKGRPGDGVMQPLSLLFTMGGVDLEQAMEAAGGRRSEFLAPQPGLARYGSFSILYDRWVDDLRLEFPGVRPLFSRFSGNALRPGEISGSATMHVPRVDATDGAALSRAEIEGRRLAWRVAQFMRAHVPGFESAYLQSTAAHIGVRETRRIVGEYSLTYEDVLETRSFDDVVALGGFYVDIHSYEGASTGVIPRRGALPKVGGAYDIPYRCLVPQKVENLLAAGRCVSATHEGQASLRVIGTVMALGQAAGTASALSLREGVSPRALDRRLLQRELMRQGAYLGERFASAEPPLPDSG